VTAGDEEVGDASADLTGAQDDVEGGSLVIHAPTMRLALAQHHAHLRKS